MEIEQTRRLVADNPLNAVVVPTDR